MEEFRHIGEVLGSLKALLVLQDDIQINRHQCTLLFDIFTLAFNTIADEIKQNLKVEEKNTKWKAIEHPLRELHRVFKEGDIYVRHCLDNKDWWGKAISLYKNKDCVEFHIHNLLCYFPAVIEAIETAGEISGLDQDEMQRKKVVLLRKYNKDWNDPKLFEKKFGKQYLVCREICRRIESAWKEDKWILVEALNEKRGSGSVALTKNELRLGDLLLKKLTGNETIKDKLFPTSILLGAKDYQVRRRLGGGDQYKEIHWLGQNFALRHFFGEIETLTPEISTLLSISHPNILQYLCGFYDEEKKECFLVMELMNKDLCSHMKENCSPRRKILFSIPVIVDLMLQIARGMEYLHSQKIYHGELNPSSVLLKARNLMEGYFHAKITGFGLSSVKTNHVSRDPPEQNGTSPFWYAPEVLAEQEKHPESTPTCKYTEKADVYSFAMICFQILTGKVPFEDGHLQGDKSTRNLRAGERPLFPYTSPKYLVNLTKKCWQTDPNQRPSFSSICRILRYTKKFLIRNYDRDHPELQTPLVDYCELEAEFLKKFSGKENIDFASVSQVPYQMFAFRLAEREKTNPNNKNKNSESTSDIASTCKDEIASLVEDPVMPATKAKSVCCDIRSVYSDTRSVCSDAPQKKVSLVRKKPADLKIKRVLVSPKVQTPRKSPLNPCGRSLSLNSSREARSLVLSPLSPIRRKPWTPSLSSGKS